MRRLLTLLARHTSQPNKRLQKQPKVKPDDSKMEVADGCCVVTLVYVFLFFYSKNLADENTEYARAQCFRIC